MERDDTTGGLTMSEKLPIHIILGVSEERSDMITDAVTAAFAKHGSVREMVEYVSRTHDPHSVIAGIALDVIITDFVIDTEESDNGM